MLANENFKFKKIVLLLPCKICIILRMFQENNHKKTTFLIRAFQTLHLGLSVVFVYLISQALFLLVSTFIFFNHNPGFHLNLTRPTWILTVTLIFIYLNCQKQNLISCLAFVIEKSNKKNQGRIRSGTSIILSRNKNK